MATETRYSDLEERSAVASAAGHPAPAASQEFSLLDLLILLAERRKTILYFTGAFAVVSIVVSLLLPVWYTANVTLMPPQQNTSLGSAIASQLGSLGSMAALAGAGSLGLKNPNDMYVGMLTSQTVEDRMVHDFELQREYHKKLLSDARKTFEKHATVDGSGKDGLHSYCGGGPQPGPRGATGERLRERVSRPFAESRDDRGSTTGSVLPAAAGAGQK